MQVAAVPRPPAGETRGDTMTNRISPYETGWLSMLVARRLATLAEAREAMNRVAQAAIDEMERRRKASRKEKRSRRRRRRDDQMDG